MSKIIITIDPGHGQNHNPGSVAPYYEGNVMFTLAQKLKKHLESTGIFTAHLTRNSLKDNPTLEQRGALAITTKSEIFISLHSNAPGANSDPKKIFGSIIFYSVRLPDSKTLALQFVNTVVNTMKTDVPSTYSRGASTQQYPGNANLDYYGVMRASMDSGSKVKYSYLIEHGFHTNPQECAWLNKDSNLEKLAKNEATLLYNTFKDKVDNVPSKPPCDDDTSKYNRGDIYEVFTPLNKYNSAADAMASKNAVNSTFKPGKYFVYRDYFNGAINITTADKGLKPGSWINPNLNIKPKVVEEYKVIVKLNGYGNAADAMACNGKVSYIVEPGTYYVYKKFTNGSINITTDKTGEKPGAWINPNLNAEPEIDTFGLHALDLDAKNFFEILPDQAIAYVKDINPNYKLTCSIEELVYYFVKAGSKEDIRWDLAFCQSIVETGCFKYGGQVDPSQNNYAGIGALNGGAAGATFKTPYIGALAQIQHLKAYSSKFALNEDCVDPRFHLVTRGYAPYVEWLGRDDNPNNKDLPDNKQLGWAVPGKGYGEAIISILNKINKY